MSLTGKDIQAEMEKANRSDCIPPALLEKCAMLCNKYNLTGKVFEYQLEAFLMNSESGKLTVDIFGKFEQDLHKTHFQVSWKLKKQCDCYSFSLSSIYMLIAL